MNKNRELEELIKWSKEDTKKRSITTDWLWKAGFTVVMILIIIWIISYFSKSKNTKLTNVKNPLHQLDGTYEFRDEMNRVVPPSEIAAGKYALEKK